MPLSYRGKFWINKIFLFLSSVIEGANGIQKSLCFMAKLILVITQRSRGSAIINLLPSDLGPHSSPPLHRARILPFVNSSPALPSISP